MSSRWRTVGPWVAAVLGVLGSVSPAGAQLAGRTIRIGVGGLLTGGAATFGVEMKQAVELAIQEQNAAGGLLGATLAAEVADDGASADKGRQVAQGFCADSTVLGVVGHVDSGVTIAASDVYAGCGLLMLTPTGSAEFADR